MSQEALVIEILAYFSDILIFTTIILDVIVLLSLLKAGTNHTFTSKITLCLVGSDLGLCLVLAAYNLPRRYIYHGNWSISEFQCSLQGALIITNIAISIVAVFGIALDRWLTICLGIYMSENVGNILVACLLTVPPLMWFSPFFFEESASKVYALQPSTLICILDWPSQLPYTRSLSIVAIVFVIFIMTFITMVYSQIFLLYRSLLLKKKQQKLAENSSSISPSSYMKYEFTPKELQLLFKCLAMTLSFVTLWAPYFVKIVYEVSTNTGVPPLMDAFADIAAFLYAFSNPFLLIMLDSHTRTFVKDNFPRLWFFMPPNEQEGEEWDEVTRHKKMGMLQIGETVMPAELTAHCAEFEGVEVGERVVVVTTGSSDQNPSSLFSIVTHAQDSENSSYGGDRAEAGAGMGMEIDALSSYPPQETDQDSSRLSYLL